MCRFVPEEMTFDDKQPTSVAQENFLMSDYTPPEYIRRRRGRGGGDEVCVCVKWVEGK